MTHAYDTYHDWLHNEQDRERYEEEALKREDEDVIDGLLVADYAREQIGILETLFAGTELLPIRCAACGSDHETVARDRAYLGVARAVCCEDLP